MKYNTFAPIQIAKKAELPIPPTETNPVTYIGVTATSVSAATPDAWRNMVCDFMADAEFYLVFNSAAATVSDSATSGATVGVRIPADTKVSYYIPPWADFNYFAVKCATGTAKLRVAISSV